MLEYTILLTIEGVIALAASTHYMHKAGYDIHDIYKGIH
jgi:hypothetical protein